MRLALVRSHEIPNLPQKFRGFLRMAESRMIPRLRFIATFY
jgi:hypothetical protein